MRFPAKPLERSGGIGVARGKELEGDVAAQARVLGAIDLTHPALPRQASDAVRSDEEALRESFRSSPASGCGAEETSQRAGSENVGGVFAGEQGLAQDCDIAPAGLSKPGGAVFWVDLKSTFENALDAAPRVRSQCRN